MGATESWDRFLETTGDSRLILLTTKAATAYTDIAFRADDILIVGQESSGVPRPVHERAEARIRIPLRPGLRSLNVALAGAMVLGEALRQTKGFPDFMTNDRKQRARIWFEQLRDSICAAFEAIERDHTGQMADRPAGSFDRKSWSRPSEDGKRRRRRHHGDHAGPGVRKGRRQCLDR